MTTVDTNVLVRLLTNDDPVQSPRAARVFSSDDVFIAKTVLLETEWVLRFTYRLPPTTIGQAFEGLLTTATVTVEDAAAVRTAVDAHRAGMDFADALHMASAAGGATKFVTFDRGVGRAAGRAKAAPTVEVL